MKWFLLKWDDIIQEMSNLFHQTSMRFHSAMATLESQKYVIARTVWTENIPLVSGHLVHILFPSLTETLPVLDPVSSFEAYLGITAIFACKFSPALFRQRLES